MKLAVSLLKLVAILQLGKLSELSHTLIVIHPRLRLGGPGPAPGTHPRGHRKRAARSLTDVGMLTANTAQLRSPSFTAAGVAGALFRNFNRPRRSN